MTTSIDGFAGAPPIAVSTDEVPTSPDEALRVVRVRVGEETGYTATNLDPTSALAVAALIVDKVYECSPWSEPQQDLVAWALTIELVSGGGGVEAAAQRLADRIIAEAVRLSAPEGDGGA